LLRNTLIYPIIIIVLGLYIYINFEVLIWDLISPEGFWGFVWFYSASVIGIMLFVGFLEVIEFIIQWRKLGGKNLLETIPIIAIYVLGAFFYFGMPALMSKKLNDKYKHINKSERYFSEGKFDKALFYAEKVYLKSHKPNRNNPFFLIPYLYVNYVQSETVRKIKIYQAELNYAYCLQSSGEDLNLADSLYNNCLQLAKSEFRDNKDFLIPPLAGLAQISMGKGEYEQAEMYFKEFSNLALKMRPDDAKENLDVMLFYYMLAVRNGNVDQAIKILDQTVSIIENSEDLKETSSHLRLLCILIEDNLRIHNLEKVGELIHKAENFADSKKKKEVYLDYLNVKADYFFNLAHNPQTKTPPRQISGLKNFINSLFGGKRENFNYISETESLLKKVTIERGKRSGEDHIDFAIILKKIADFYLRTNSYDKAEESINQALQIVETQKDNSINVYYSILFSAALIHFAKGEKDITLNEITDFEQYLIRQINSNFAILSEQERESYVSSLGSYFDLINSVYIALNDSNLVSRIYNNTLAVKSSALFSSFNFRESLISSGNDKLIRSYNQLSKRKRDFERLQNTGVQNQELLFRMYDSIQNVESEIKKVLANTSKFNEFKIDAVNCLDLKKVLQDNEVAIEFLRLPINPLMQDSVKYYALIIKKDFIRPCLIPLFNENEVIKILQQKGSTQTKINKIYSDESIVLLKKLIWNPIKQYLPDSGNVYLSVTGILHQISFPVLTLNEKYNISIVSSTRSLLYKNRDDILSDSAKKSALLFGGIDYQKNKVSPRETWPDTIKNEITLVTYLRSSFSQLKYAGFEVDSIYSILEKHEWNCDTVKGKNATINSFRNLISNAPNIVHLATHGFYYPGNQSYRASEILFGSSEYSSYLNNPMFRSGIVFAPSQKLKTTNQLNNGILTSYEISQLNLSDIDLLVLSACETGLGDIKGYEGVFGLQRAFKLAGVNSLILSLWKVSDEETSELMTSFYLYYMSGMTKQKALKKAQSKIKSKYKDPFYWGGFILIE